MSPCRTEYGVGTVQTGEAHTVFRPKNHFAPQSKVGVMYCHGAGGTAQEALTYGGIAHILSTLGNDRVVFAGDLGGLTWGNDTAMARIATAKTYLQGSSGGAKTGKMALVGLSMGGCNALVWAAANPALVSCIVAVIPVINLTDMHSNNRGGTASIINDAYAGGWSQGTYGAAHNPLTLAQAGKFTGIPILLFYGTTDPLCVPEQAIAFGAAVGADVTLVPIAAGHDFQALGPGYAQQAVDFINTHAV